MRDWKQEIRSYLETSIVDPVKEEEILEELSMHLSDRYEELLSRGWTEDEAYREVMKQFHDGRFAAELRSIIQAGDRPTFEHGGQRGNFIAELWQNFRFGVRQLRFNKAFAAVMILSLALGIGANTAIFQLLNAVRIRTLPVQKPEELAVVKLVKAPHGRTGRAIGSNSHLTYALWEQLRDQQQAFSKIAVWFSDRLNLSPGGEARYAQALFVSGSFFDVVGIQPVIGRLISPLDDQKSCATSAVVLSEAFWKREFGGDPAVLGRKLLMDGHPFVISGVSPATFFGIEVGRNFDVAVPLCAERFYNPNDSYQVDLATWWLGCLGRLKPGWTLERASAQLAAISRGILTATTPPNFDAIDKKYHQEMEFGAIAAANGVSNVRRQYENPLWLLLGISGFVLLIACANLANLMIARASARQKEMAVRLALGASRGQLIRQMLAESMVLAIAGALFGAVLAHALSRLLVSFLSTQRRVLFLDLQPDWHVILFTAGLAIFTCLIFGLMPAIQAARIAPAEAMKANSRAITAARSRFASRRLLVVSQVALSLMLLVGALLFVRTFRNLITLDAGFRHERLLITNLELIPAKVPPERRVEYKQRLLERIRSTSGVQSAATAAIVPLSGSGWNQHIDIPGTSVQREIANFNQVSDGYFKTVGTKLLAGRDFDHRDTKDSQPVAIVTQTFVRKFLKTQNPVGMSVRMVLPEGEPERIFRIIGLVNDAKYTELREEFTPVVYLAAAQDKFPEEYLQVLVRSPETLGNLTASIKFALRETNPAIGIEFRPFRDLMRQGLLRERLMATLSGFFGLIAAVLAMIGLYGVISFMVARRRNEIGIRIALGANRKNILSMIMKEAGTLLLAGLALGTFLALITGSTARTLLFGMQPNDPITLLLAILALGLVAVLAGLLPAQRAATLDPTQALREE